jgi:glycosyltransferase involved in cell wall biosynthesis
MDYGDPYDINTFSGSSRSIWNNLNEKGILVEAFTPYPSRPIKLLFQMASFRPSIQKWRASWRRSLPFKRFISKRAAQIIHNKYEGHFDAILQIGAYYDISDSYSGIRTLLADNNCAITQHTNINFQSSNAIYLKQFEFEKRVYNSMDAVFCFSHFLADSMINDFGCKPDRVKVVYAGININEDLINTEQKDYSARTLLFSGYDFVNKGGQVLLDAFGKVRQEIPDAKLILLGPTLPSVPDGVTNYGPLSKDDPKQMALISDSFRRATVFVLPTFADAFPNVIREAMAARLPVVASKIGSIPEMVTEGITGFLVPTREVDTLAQALLRLLKDTTLCQRMGQVGYEVYREKFRWDSVTDIILKTINELAAERK